MNALISQTPQAQIVTAGKALVDKLLAMNTRNRKHKSAHIKAMAHEINAGQFWLTGSGIGVSKTGVLLDGQNRLMAIKAAGYAPVQFVLVTGLEDESQRAVDRHARRSLSDALTMHMNMTVSTQMVALANALHAFGATRGKTSPFVSTTQGNSPLTDSVAADFMAEHGALAADLVKATNGVKAPVMAAIFVYAIHRHDDAMQFARDVSKGINLAEDHPAYRLRSAIERLKRANDSAGRTEIFKIAANACITHSKGATVKQLKPVESWESAPWKWAISGTSIFDQQGFA